MKSVIKGAGYILVHTPDMVLHNGTTQTTERIVNPESEYLKELPSHIRSFDQALSYWPNQVYIGNKHPDQLAEVAQPWCDKTCDVNDRFGPFGQIMPQEEFLLLMQACDVFGLVKLEQGFVNAHRAALAANPIMDESILARIPEAQTEASEIINILVQFHLCTVRTGFNQLDYAQGVFHLVERRGFLFTCTSGLPVFPLGLHLLDVGTVTKHNIAEIGSSLRGNNPPPKSPGVNIGKHPRMVNMSVGEQNKINLTVAYRRFYILIKILPLLHPAVNKKLGCTDFQIMTAPRHFMIGSDKF